MSSKASGGPLRRLGRNEMVHREATAPLAGQRFNCGFDNLIVSRAVYRRVADGDTPYVLVAILEGEGKFRGGAGQSERFAPGDAFQRYPGQQSEMILPVGTHLVSCYVTIPNALFDILRMANAIPVTAPAVLHPGKREEISTRMNEILRELREAGPGEFGRSLLLTHSLLLDIYHWHNQAVNSAQTATSLTRARHLLGTAFEKRAPLAEVARKLGYDYSTFRREFRSQTGLSPGQYRIRCRMERAQELLGVGILSIKSIAYRLGYPEAQSFSRQFKRTTGFSPRQFQKNVCQVVK